MNNAKFKTNPREHQLAGLAAGEGREGFAYLCEMGTGKTWIGINEAAALWGAGKIDSLFIVAPKGVHMTWVMDQIPKHMPDWVRYRAHAWNGKTTKKEEKAMSAIIAPSSGDLRVLAMNWDALVSKRGFDAAVLFATTAKQRGLMVVADESQRAKNPSAERTKRLFKLKPFSGYRRILSGTPILQSPFDAFSQFTWLDEYIFGTTSFYSFKTEYAELMQPGNRLFDHIVKNKVRMPKETREAAERYMNDLHSILSSNGRGELVEMCDVAQSLFESNEMQLFIAKLNEMRTSFAPGNSEPKRKAISCIAMLMSIASTHHARKTKMMSNPRKLPQIVEKGKDGAPKYKNLDKLKSIIDTVSYRVLLKDCVDLPDKIYKRTLVGLAPAQRATYRKMKEEARIILSNKDEAPVTKLAAVTKLMQICSNFIILPDGTTTRVCDENPKLDVLEESIEDSLEAGSSIIVWAHFKRELRDIAELCERRGWTFCKYDGETSSDDRVKHIEDFEAGRINVFIGQQKAGGTGITLVRANHVIYYSNSFALEDRLQSEARAHRIGQTRNVVYEDIVCQMTIEEKVLTALQNKADLARIIIDGDGGLALIEGADDE